MVDDLRAQVAHDIVAVAGDEEFGRDGIAVVGRLRSGSGEPESLSAPGPQPEASSARALAAARRAGGSGGLIRPLQKDTAAIREPPQPVGVSESSGLVLVGSDGASVVGSSGADSVASCSSSSSYGGPEASAAGSSASRHSGYR